MNDLKKPIIILVVLLTICALAYVVTGRPSQTPSDVAPVAESDEPSPPSDEIMAYLAESKGFEYLVSYTGNGFEPQSLTIQKGEAVRFTNNSGEGLWVAASGAAGAVYPGTGAECGQSSFDSCKVLKRGEFWEFTFNTGGTWSFQNNSVPTKTATVTVTVQ